MNNKKSWVVSNNYGHQRTILIYSGGADSTTLLYWLLDQEHDVTCLTFNYGQRHDREIQAAKNIVMDIGGINHIIFDMPDFRRLAASSLLGNWGVPHGHYEEESMKLTVVPNRNMVMISIAASLALSINADNIAIGAHAGDHAIYPDCRPWFLFDVQTAIHSGNWGEKKPKVIAPFVNMDKTEIIRTGLELGVPYSMTWTCYEGGREPCGKCGSCVERKEAFEAAA